MLIKNTIFFIAVVLCLNVISVSAQNTYPWPSSANIGIGTASPDQILTINAGTGANSLISFKQNGTTKAYVGLGMDGIFRNQTVSGTELQLRAEGANFISLWTNGAENIRLNSSGKFGIGTTSPWAKLDVRTAGANGGDHEALNIQNPSSAAYATVSMTLGSGSSSFSNISAQRNNLANGSSLIFQTSDNTGTIQPRLFINDAGSVGIGTQNYPARLTIYTPNTSDGMWIAGPNNKNVALLSSTTTGAWNSLTQPGDNLLLWKGTTLDNTDAGGLVIGTWSGSPTGIRIGSSGNVGIGIAAARTKLDVWGGDLVVTGNDHDGTAYITSHGGIAYYGNNLYNNGLAITPTGAIGIGTSAPGPHKLAVEGSIGARKIKVTLDNPWADFVFDQNYLLPTLSEVEQFIQKNKHLPGVPSAKEVEKNGLDIGETQAILLQKIEELTLYVIQQQKEIEQLKAKIK
jgi:hypothetical protein